MLTAAEAICTPKFKERARKQVTKGARGGMINTWATSWKRANLLHPTFGMELRHSLRYALAVFDLERR